MKEEIIKGLNREKEILTRELVSLNSSNRNIDTRSSIELRLSKIDNFIKELIKDTND